MKFKDLIGLRTLRLLSWQAIWVYLWNLYHIQTGQVLKLKPLFFTVYTNLRCNFHCSYCDLARNGYTKHYHNELSTNDMLDLLKLLRKESRYIYFTGGEPTLRKDIVELLRACKQLGFRGIVLNTNMSQIHTKMEVLDYITTLVVSLDMMDDSKYSKILGVSEKTVASVKRNIEACVKSMKEKNFDMVVNCVVTPNTVDHARDVMWFCFDHNIKFALAPAELDGGAVDPCLRDSNEYQELVSDMIRFKKSGRLIFGSYQFLKIIHRFSGFNCYPTMTPHIYPNGDLLYPCEPMKSIPVNILKAGSYVRALAAGMDGFGPLPTCRNRCYKSCYIEPSLIFGKTAA